MKKKLIIFAALLTSAVLNAQDTVISEFPWADGFESPNSFSSWNILDLNASTSDNWTRYSSYAHTGSYSVRSSYNSSDNCNEWLVTPALQLPYDADGFTLKWWVRGSSYSGNQAHYTVLVSTSGTDTADFSDTLFAETYPTNTYVERGVSLEDYAGQTIHIAFIHDSYNDNGLYLDDIAVRCTLLPVVGLSGPTQASEGDTLRFAAHLTEGDSASTTYSWSSTMETAGYADLLPYDDSLMVIYTGGGTDTITLIASNSYGADTATTVVRVCGSVATFPWEEGFESAQSLTCWTLLDLNASTSDNWNRYSGNLNSHSGNYSLRSNYNSSDNSNEWLVTPPLLLPDDAEGFVIKWWVKGSTYSNHEAHYTVLLSTSGSDTSNFTDTLFAEAYSGDYASRTASLESYAGQTVRIAFVHDSYNDNGLYLDDIAVRTILLPVVSADGPASTFTNAPTSFAATLVEGSTDGLAYTWSNSLAGSTLTPNGDSLSILYTLGGTDTVVVTATNAHGSSTDTLIVQVIDCPTISTFPWSEGFEGGENALMCWSIIDNNNYANDNWLLVDNYELAYEGSHCIGAPYREYGTNDDYIVSPAIALPADASDLYLSYYVSGGEYEGNVTTYQTLVSTTGIAPADFTDVLLSESYSGDYVRRSISLAPYGGQTIHFAFRHTSYDADNLLIDNVTIDTNGTSTPVSCPAPEVTTVTESETTITVAWTGTAFAYEAAIVSGNWTAPASGTSVLTSTYTFSSLNPSTAYTVGIRSICADGSRSEWTTTQVTTASTCRIISFVSGTPSTP